MVVEKFGLREKHIAAAGRARERPRGEAAERLLGESEVDPETIDAGVYFGSSWKDWGVWQASPWIAHRLGCGNAFALEYDNVSHGSPTALRLARDLLRAEDELAASCSSAPAASRTCSTTGTSARASCSASATARSRARRRRPGNELLGAHAITDGSFSQQVKVAGGGSIDPTARPSSTSPTRGR